MFRSETVMEGTHEGHFTKAVYGARSQRRTSFILCRTTAEGYSMKRKEASHWLLSVSWVLTTQQRERTADHWQRSDEQRRFATTGLSTLKKWGNDPKKHHHTGSSLSQDYIQYKRPPVFSSPLFLISYTKNNPPKKGIRKAKLQSILNRNWFSIPVPRRK